LVKVLARAWINDEPDWVIKSLKKIRHKEELLKQEMTNELALKKQREQAERLRKYQQDTLKTIESLKSAIEQKEKGHVQKVQEVDALKKRIDEMQRDKVKDE